MTLYVSWREMDACEWMFDAGFLLDNCFDSNANTVSEGHNQEAAKSKSMSYIVCTA